MPPELMLPTAEGARRHVLAAGSPWPAAHAPPRSRIAFAAAHVAAHPSSTQGPSVDWEATLAYRDHLWGLGFGVAEAMDTAQRGTGLDWEATQELIRRSGLAARSSGGRLACGAGTDQLAPGARSLTEISAAYEEQVSLVEDAGAQVVLMASRSLAATARNAEDYLAVYGALLRQAAGPVILHWLGPMFDPALAGYWGSEDLALASDTVLALIAEHARKVDGIKLSLLDARLEVAFRRELAPGVRLYTGDDLHYPDLIRGDEEGFSHALLGVFDAIAPPAAAALGALDRGEQAEYDAIMRRTIPLAHALFEAPTYAYKTGIVFLAWLCGHQRDFTMLGEQQHARTAEHLVRLFRHADEANLFPDPELAAARMARLLGDGVPAAGRAPAP